MGDSEDVEERGPEFDRSVGIALIPRLLVTWVVRTLPASARGRYREEFSAELVDLSSACQVVHAVGLLWSSRSLARDLDPGPAAPALHRRLGFLVPLSVAAAVLAIMFAAGLAAQDAQPGDTLWGLARILYPDHARSVEGAVATDTALREAEEALANGRIAEGKSILNEARHVLPTVSSEDGKADLAARHAEMVARFVPW